LTRKQSKLLCFALGQEVMRPAWRIPEGLSAILFLAHYSPSFLLSNLYLVTI